MPDSSRDGPQGSPLPSFPAPLIAHRTPPRAPAPGIKQAAVPGRGIPQRGAAMGDACPQMEREAAMLAAPPKAGLANAKPHEARRRGGPPGPAGATAPNVAASWRWAVLARTLAAARHGEYASRSVLPIHTSAMCTPATFLADPLPVFRVFRPGSMPHVRLGPLSWKCSSRLCGNWFSRKQWLQRHLPPKVTRTTMVCPFLHPLAADLQHSAFKHAHPPRGCAVCGS